MPQISEVHEYRNSRLDARVLVLRRIRGFDQLHSADVNPKATRTLSRPDGVDEENVVRSFSGRELGGLASGAGRDAQSLCEHGRAGPVRD